MAKLEIKEFGGYLGAVDPLFLGKYAQQCENVDLRTGKLVPLKGLSTIAGTSGTPFTITYKTGIGWVEFDNSKYVFYVPSFTSSYAGVYYTVEGGSYPRRALYSGLPSTYEQLGIPAPTSDPSSAANLGSDDGTGVQDYVSYVYTFVNARGEESAPSSPTDTIEVQNGEGVTLSNLADPTYNGTPSKLRIYRLSHGLTSSEYLYLDEIDYDETSYQDYDGSSGLKEAGPDVLETTYWSEPPDALEGLVEFQNGLLAGFTGNSLYVCETYVPYAWPENYEMKFPTEIVALASYNGNLIVGTKDNPYVVTGTSGENLTMVPLLYRQSCKSGYAMSVTDSGVVYPSPDGLFLTDGSNGSIITKDVWTKEQWRTLVADVTYTSIFHDNKYYAFKGAGYVGIIVDFNTSPPNVTNFTLDSGVDIVGVARIPHTDQLYVVDSANNEICEFNGGSNLTMEWKSAEFTDQNNYTCAKIDADYSEGHSVTFKLYRDGVADTTYTVTSDDMFRLQSKAFSRIKEIYLSADIPINSITLATSPLEL